MQAIAIKSVPTKTGGKAIEDLDADSADGIAKNAVTFETPSAKLGIINI
jgi:hypothetical protein